MAYLLRTRLGVSAVVALIALVALLAFNALAALVAHGALRALLAGRALAALVTGCTGGTGRARNGNGWRSNDDIGFFFITGGQAGHGQQHRYYH